MGAGAMEASSPAAFDGDGTSTTIEDLPADVLALVLRRLDGASLAAVGCASSGLHGLATDPDTWRALCLAMWPSVRDLLPCLGLGGGDVDHRAFFADAFPFPCSDSPSPPPPSPSHPQPQPLPARLVSAVDLSHAGVSILSRVVETDADSDWFLGAPFRVDALVQEGFTLPTAASASGISHADLELNWVLLDPATGRALNASSRRAVAVDRKWLTGDTVARFAVVLSGGEGGVALDAAVTCDERYGHVREVSLRVEDADGAGVSGRDGLAAVAAAMAAPRRRGCRGGAAAEDAARERYEDFVRGKRARKEWKARREGILDLCCSGVGAAAFLGFLVMLTFR
ncbi:probable F-box protein At2g36090 [Miscanthus floridulus]|uniref:probable F-box protein At2g36090 n=1 Tax=Miscanthus floridulus TaxID=154761 RepID=UPI003458C137